MIPPGWNRTNTDKSCLGKISVGTCTTGFLGIEPLNLSENVRKEKICRLTVVNLIPFLSTLYR